ncbi:protein YgfX [Pantoea stewartii]|uniref:protein YgfX n=1 Tax=Pantoea stewartii TaxID=66269 RepID=UPI00197E5650
MNAARWQCNLHPSLQARTILALTLVVTLAGVGLMPLSAAAWVIKPVLFALIVWEGWRQDRRLCLRCGALRRDSARDWHWQDEHWQTQQPLYWLPGAVLLVMKNPQGRITRFWLMQDNMQPAEWRALRACCFRDRQRAH